MSEAWLGDCSEVMCSGPGLSKSAWAGEPSGCRSCLLRRRANRTLALVSPVDKDEIAQVDECADALA